MKRAPEPPTVAAGARAANLLHRGERALPAGTTLAG
jgi:hypothetical protein